MKITIRSIQSEPAQADKDKSSFTIEFELEDEQSNRIVDFINVITLDLNSLNLMLPDLFKDYMLQRESNIIKHQSHLLSNLDKQTFIYDDKLKKIQ